MPCQGCGLPDYYCACNDAFSTPLPLQLALLLHENEPARPSNTSRLIKQQLPATQQFIWQRTVPPTDLLHLLQQPDYLPCLLFPADRPDLQARPQVSPEQLLQSEKTPLIVVPDGTWKEVRKIVRKSPWLDSLPLLSFEPENRTRYTLRRNPDQHHLCTAETASELLQQMGEPGAATALEQQLTRFLVHYHAWQNHLNPPQD